MNKQSLEQAVQLARTGKSRELARAARVLHGLPQGGWPQTQQAMRDLRGFLPIRELRDYTVSEFISACYATGGESGDGPYRSSFPG